MTGSIAAVWFQGKGSIFYCALLLLSLIFLSVASFNWLFNDKCEDVEDWGSNEVIFDTKVGPSLILMFIAMFFAIIGVLLSSIHLINPIYDRRQQRIEQTNQPRIQSHSVN